MRRFDRLTSSFAVRVLPAACTVALIAVAGSVVDGCYSGATGSAPNDKAFYYPVGLALSGALAHAPDGFSHPTTRSDYLFVASSDFDLAFNAGTVAAVNLDAVEQNAHVAEFFGSSSTDPGSFPELGNDAQNFITGSVRIGAFAADMIVTALYDSTGAAMQKKGRIFIPVRGDGALTYIDYDLSTGSLTLDCGGQTYGVAFGESCGTDHHVGNDSTKDSRQIVMDGQPFAISAVTGGPSDAVGSVGGDARINENPPQKLPDSSGNGPLGGVLVTADQSTGDVSLFVNALIAGATPTAYVPTLSYSLTGLPTFATAVAPVDFLAPSGGDANYTSRFLVTNRSSSTIGVVNLLADQSDIQRSALTESPPIPITTNAGGSDTRAIAVDPPNPGETPAGATPRPTRIFLSSRAPASVVTGQIDPVTGNVTFYANTPLPVGPSRLTRTSFVAADGTTHTRLFLTSYDAREIVAYDPDSGRIGNVIHTGRGPYAFAYDSARKLAYVANFIDNTVQVIELDEVNHSATYEKIVYTVGIAKGPQL